MGPRLNFDTLIANLIEGAQTLKRIMGTKEWLVDSN
jgi:hypothetical protein